jgi:hypothetical protein
VYWYRGVSERWNVIVGRRCVFPRGPISETRRRPESNDSQTLGEFVGELIAVAATSSQDRKVVDECTYWYVLCNGFKLPSADLACRWPALRNIRLYALACIAANVLACCSGISRLAVCYTAASVARTIRGGQSVLSLTTLTLVAPE